MTPTFDVQLVDGPARGAYFAGHALAGEPPLEVQVAVGGENGPALLDLPDDELELGERVVTYRLHGITGIVCTRGRGGRCARVAGYGVAPGSA